VVHFGTGVVYIDVESLAVAEVVVVVVGCVVLKWFYSFSNGVI